MAAGAATVAVAVIATATVLATGGPPGQHSGGHTAAGPTSPAGPGAQPSPSGTRHGVAPRPVSVRGAGGTASPGRVISAGELGAALGTGARSSGGTGGSGGTGRTGTGGTSPAGAGTGGTGSGTGSGTGGVTPGGGTGTPTVSVAPSVLVLASLLGRPATGTLTLTAGNVPVTHYTISIPSSLIGKLSVSPASGSIGAGQSTRVTVTLSGLLSVDTTITVNPGGHSVTVLLGAGL